MLLLSGETDIVCIVETWLTDSYPDSLLSCAGAFQVVRSDRGSRGGGVLFLLRKGIPFVYVPTADGHELIALDLVSKHGKYRVLGAYFPPRPDATVFNSACAEISRLLDAGYPTIILGDFNCAEIDWTLSVKPKGAVPNSLLEFTITAGLDQLVTEPTRQNNFLDLVLATHSDTVNKVNVIEPFSTSDHNAVDISIAWEQPAEEIETYRDFRSANWSAMRNYLGTVDWAHLLGCTFSVQACWDVIYWHLTQAIGAFVPAKTYRSAMDPLPLYLRKLRSKRRRLFRRGKTSVLASAKAKSFTVYYRKKLRNFCKKQEQQILSGNSINALFKFIRKKTKTRSAIPSLQTDSDAIQTDAVKAEIFNKFFGSVYRQDSQGTVRSENREFHSELDTVSITSFTVGKVLSKMSGKLSCGPDGIPSFLYKQCKNVLAFPLALLFSRSLAMGDLPEIWKRSLIVPIFKKGNKSLPTNYRPVSLTCAAMLIFERCIKVPIVQHIEENNLLSDRQYGFRKGRSVDVQLLSTLNDWTNALDNGFCIDAVYTDFAKAFDTVSHSKLLIKLRAFGITGKLLAWIANYFKGRKQAVKIRGQVSRWADVISGVPQGSVLGPLFFIIFVDDLAKALPPGITIMLYADDAKLFLVYLPADWTPLLQLALSVIETWISAWDLRLAVPKCQLLFLGTANARHSYRLLGEELKAVPTIRDLGVIISEDLSWFPHISSLAAKASRCANAILKSFNYSDFELLARAYTVYVRPILESASAVWSPYLKQDKALVESVQRKYSKKLFFKCGLKPTTYEKRLELLGWQSLEERRNRADLCLMYRILKGFAVGAENLYCVHVPDITLRGNTTRLFVKRSRLDVRKYFYSSRIVTPWNALDIDISEIRNFKVFNQILTKGNADM